MVDTTVYVVIVIYILFIVALGFITRLLNKDISDYFRGGCKGTWWLVGSSTFMASFSALTFSGGAGAAFESGWSIGVVYFSGALGFVFHALWLAPWFRQLRAITGPEVINDRFGQVTQQLYAWLHVILGIVYASLFLYGLSIFISAVFGFPITIVVCVIGAVVTIYSVTGGVWAVMGTDFLQALILIPITILMAYLALKAVGGWDGFLERTHDPELASDFALFNQPGDFSAGRYTMVWSIAMLIKILIGYGTMNGAVRYFSVKDGREARKAAWLSAVLMALSGVLFFIPPMVARMLYADEVLASQLAKPAESAYAIVSLNLLPPGLIGIMVVAIMAATMSSVDTGLNRNAAIFIRDIYPLFCRLIGRKGVEGRALLRRGQAFSLVLGMTIIAMSVYFVNQKGLGVFEHIQTVGAALASPLAVPMLLALFIRRAPWWAAIVSIVCALIPSIVGMVAGWTFAQLVFSTTGTGIIVFLLSTPFWRYASTQYRDKVEAFYDKMHRPVDFEREVGAGNDPQQLIILGRFALCIGVLISLLAILPQDGHDRMCVLFVAGFVASAGSLLIYAGKRTSNAR